MNLKEIIPKLSIPGELKEYLLANYDKLDNKNLLLFIDNYFESTNKLNSNTSIKKSEILAEIKLYGLSLKDKKEVEDIDDELDKKLLDL